MAEPNVNDWTHHMPARPPQPPIASKSHFLFWRLFQTKWGRFDVPRHSGASTPGDLVVVGTFFALLVAPWHRWISSQVSLSSMLAPPSAAHVLGTDNLGRDLLLRLVDALRSAVLPLWVVVGGATLVGLAVGLFVAANSTLSWRKLQIQGFLRFFGRIIVSIPLGVIAFAWAAYNERGGLYPVAATLFGVIGVRTFLQVQDLFDQSGRLGYWQAHSAIGGTAAARLWHYGIVRDWRPVLVDGLAFHLRVAVTIEASLSYLGFGIQEPEASLGNILASHFDGSLKGHWYVTAMTCLAMLAAARFPGSLVRVCSTFYRRTESPRSRPEIG